uniref:Nuclear speckle splicing regulatory protein 1 n=1 Tax=Oreochromis niloticus TaxID=8128 RepID=I3JDQ6_ORENI
MAVPTKQYGLILPQKKGLSKTTTLPKPSVFDDDSDEETSVGESLQREAIKKKMMKQTRLEMQKALEQDSTVYDYDAVYDDIQKERLETNKKILGGTDKKPKYIHQLMKAVEDRKKEQERREERKIQKEREAEGEKFADKEAYVTSAYRQKLQEQKEEEERERREAEMEAALDVKKQKDLSGFYRHLLNQTVGEEAIPDRSANKSVIASHYLLTDEHVHVFFFFFFRSLYYITVSFTDLKLQRVQKTQKRLHLLPHLHPMKISQVQAVTLRRRMSRNLGLEEVECTIENKDEQKNQGEEKEEAEEKTNKFAKRSTDQTVSSARERYMARQMARSASKSYIEKEED